MSETKITFGGIDLLRFLAAVMVMLFHYGYWAWAYPPGLTSRAVGQIDPQPAIGAFTNFGWVGVQIFFVISGFIIAFSAEHSTPSRFLMARIKRLAPAAWICAPITVGVLMVLGIPFDKAVAIRLFSSMFFSPVGPWVDIVYWTLGIEIMFYGIVYVLLTAGRFHWIEAVALFIGATSTLFWAISHSLGWTSLAIDRMLDLLLVHHGAHFALGVTIWLIHFKGMSLSRLLSAGLFLIGCTLQMACSVQVHAEKVGETIDPTTPTIVFVAAILFMVASLHMNLSRPIWRRIGVMTYPLYLVHNVVGATILGGLYRAEMPYLLAMAIVCVLMIGASWIIAERGEPIVRSAIDHAIESLRLRLRTSPPQP